MRGVFNFGVFGWDLAGKGNRAVEARGTPSATKLRGKQRPGTCLPGHFLRVTNGNTQLAHCQHVAIYQPRKAVA
jgi:hypothetical protein